MTAIGVGAWLLTCVRHVHRLPRRSRRPSARAPRAGCPRRRAAPAGTAAPSAPSRKSISNSSGPSAASLRGLRHLPAQLAHRAQPGRKSGAAAAGPLRVEPARARLDVRRNRRQAPAAAPPGVGRRTAPGRSASCRCPSNIAAGADARTVVRRSSPSTGRCAAATCRAAAAAATCPGTCASSAPRARAPRRCGRGAGSKTETSGVSRSASRGGADAGAETIASSVQKKRCACQGRRPSLICSGYRAGSAAARNASTRQPRRRLMMLPAARSRHRGTRR